MEEHFNMKTVALGSRHMVRATKLAQQGKDAAAYVSGLASDQKADLETAVRFQERKLLDQGVAVE
jgi:hypothetical protein